MRASDYIQLSQKGQEPIDQKGLYWLPLLGSSNRRAYLADGRMAFTGTRKAVLKTSSFALRLSFKLLPKARSPTCSNRWYKYH
ncbi:hypothetical protein L249_3311 [Ophiocordyceps polyrhachis-furcata BCC 54312]|uniref:Uncharacterized protein n=1 Tax=Ophiocordyceps polyrhachis-furcata BCC 54312 TaxID=1330021 RepID=A0A367LS64_9HYPO|nr:hypothetical protein L249_3311 [Ophiocordyceps polyrhachis-furcata BCC 54312]